MLDALKPTIKDLIQDDVLRHSDVDVKVEVASYISEVTIVTAPDSAYNNNEGGVLRLLQSCSIF